MSSARELIERARVSGASDDWATAWEQAVREHPEVLSMDAREAWMSSWFASATATSWKRLRQQLSVLPNEPQWPVEPFDKCESVEDLIAQAMGAASICWQDVGAAGVFDDVRAVALFQEAMRRYHEIVDPAPSFNEHASESLHSAVLLDITNIE